MKLVCTACTEQEPLILLGGGGHCISVIDVLEKANVPIAGIVHGVDCDFESVFEYPALGVDADLPELRKKYSRAMVTVGQIKSSAVRMKLFNMVKQLHFTMPAIISPLAYVSPKAQLEEGVIVMHGAIVNAGAKIGANSIINTNALIEHECTVGAHCHIAIGTILCGNVSVGENSFIGAGSVVKQGIRIDKYCVVGMGSTVLQDISEGTFYIQKSSKNFYYS